METKPFVLQFGEGKIAVAVADGGLLLFKQDEDSHDIGEEDPSLIGVPVDLYNPDIIFTFSKVECIDVLINQLELAKQVIQAAQAEYESAGAVDE
jgi:hypothetical protein